ETRTQLSSLKKGIVKEINGNSWKDLEKHIRNVHFEFLKRLKEKHPDISPRELDLSTYCLMNMSTKEIAEVMSISNGGVELARYRLRKKLGLERKENLAGFLMNIYDRSAQGDGPKKKRSPLRGPLPKVYSS